MDFHRLVFEHTPDALFVLDRDGVILHANAMAETLFEFQRHELIGSEIEMLIPERFAARHAGLRKNYVANPHTRQMGDTHMDLHARKKNAREFSVDIMLSPLYESNAGLILCAVRDATARKAVIDQLRLRNIELEHLHERLQELASRDSLTGLLNRRTFQEQTEWMLRNSARRMESVSMLMIDLDFFKRINDHFGHGEGDRVLFAAANALQTACRQSDVAARYGGEEFAVALANTDVAGSRIVAENFRAAIENINDTKIPVTASIGIVTYMHEAAHPPMTPVLFASLLHMADEALYVAKRNGRNQSRHFDDLPREQGSDTTNCAAD